MLDTECIPSDLKDDVTTCLNTCYDGTSDDLTWNEWNACYTSCPTAIEACVDQIEYDTEIKTGNDWVDCNFFCTMEYAP